MIGTLLYTTIFYFVYIMGYLFNISLNRNVELLNHLFLVILFVNNIIIIKKYFKKNKQKKLNTIYLLTIFLYIWMLLSCLLSKNKQMSFFGDIYRKEGYFTYLLYFNLALSGFLLYKNNLFNKVLKIIVFIAFIVSIFMMIDHYPISYILFNEFKGLYVFSGPFYHFNHCGYYLLIATLISVYFYFTINGKKKYIYLIMIVVFIRTLILNNTFGAYIALLLTILGIVILLKKQYKEKILLLIIFLFLSATTTRYGTHMVLSNIIKTKKDIIIINTSEKLENINSVGNDRGELWVKGLTIISKNPIIGYGLDNTSLEYEKEGLGGKDRAHNIIIDLGMNIGIVGVCVYLLIIFIPVISIIKKRKTSSNQEILISLIIIGYMVNLMFGNSMFYTSIYFYFIFGALINIYISKQNKLEQLK